MVSFANLVSWSGREVCVYVKGGPIKSGCCAKYNDYATGWRSRRISSRFGWASPSRHLRRQLSPLILGSVRLLTIVGASTNSEPRLPDLCSHRDIFTFHRDSPVLPHPYSYVNKLGLSNIDILVCLIVLITIPMSPDSQLFTHISFEFYYFKWCLQIKFIRMKSIAFYFR